MSGETEGKTCSFDVCFLCNGTCCIDAKPPLTQNRINIINMYIQQQELNLKDTFTREEYTHPSVDTDGFCVFYNKESRKCKIHPVKPETCVAGPITFDINTQTQKIEYYLKKSQICSFAQSLYNNKTRFEQHLEAAKAQIVRLAEELDASALQAIMKIPEPYTFKIFESEVPNEIIKKIKPA